MFGFTVRRASSQSRVALGVGVPARCDLHAAEPRGRRSQRLHGRKDHFLGALGGCRITDGIDGEDDRLSCLSSIAGPSLDGDVFGGTIELWVSGIGKDTSTVDSVEPEAELMRDVT